MKKAPKIKLIPLDMSKSDGNNHPDIKTGRTQYLCLIGGKFYAGSFSREKEDEGPFMNFDGWEGSCLQFDAPGTNSSGWQQIWEIRRVSGAKKKK